MVRLSTGAGSKAKKADDEGHEEPRHPPFLRGYCMALGQQNRQGWSLNAQSTPSFELKGGAN